VARRVARGEIWLHRFAAPDKRRPVVVLSRNDALEVLSSAIVAPITSAIRGLPSEVVVGVEQGLKSRSAVNLDHVQTVNQVDLQRFVGALSTELMADVCRALGVATSCAGTRAEPQS
jgi:mRNA interferase MazF